MRPPEAIHQQSELAKNLENVPCGLCGASETDLLHQKQTPDGVTFSIVRCRKCGLVYVNPRKREDVIAATYRDSSYFQRDEKSSTGYSDYTADKELHVRFFQRQLKTLEATISKGRLLDIGCAFGFLLEEAKKRGWNVQGVEMSDFAATHARDDLHVPVFTGTLREAALPADSFDAAVMDDVIEHAGDPAAEIREVCRVLRPSGVFMLHTPNEASPWHWLMGSHWIHLKPEEHLYYFSPKTLSAMLEKCGFEVVYAHACSKVTNAAYIVGVLGKLAPGLSSAVNALFGSSSLLRRPFPFRGGGFEILARKK